MPMIFPTWPVFDEEDVESVGKVLRSGHVNYWTGNECRSFEREFAEYVGVDFAVALANGTVALELALLASGVKRGDEVIVTGRSFFASAASISRIGAIPVFVDVGLDTQNITADSIESALTPSTRAIVCVHLAGWPCDMDPIRKIAHVNGLMVVEDCAQAHGATYKGRKVGSLGDVAAWSFCQDKIMSTGGEGGMITTNSETMWEFIWSFKDHGKSPEALKFNLTGPAFRWLHESIGSNFRMTEMQAAIGRRQLSKLDDWVKIRNSNAERIEELLSDLAGERGPLRIPTYPLRWRTGRVGESELCSKHAFYKFYFFIREEYLSRNVLRDQLIDQIRSMGVPCFSGTCPEIYKEAAYRKLDKYKDLKLVNCENLGNTSMMILVHPTLTQSHIDSMCAVITDVINNKCRKK